MDSNLRWLDWVNALLGSWLMLSPLLLGYAGLAAINSVVVGGAVLLFSGVALARPRLWEEWVNLAIAMWLIASPYLLVFGGKPLPLWNHLILGLLIGGNSLWAMQRQRPEAA